MPREETCGTCRQFTCKYHAWRYDLDGKLTFVQQEEEFFDLDKSATDWSRCTAKCGKASSSSTSPNEPEQSLTDFLGPMITDLEGYPFEKMTSRFITAQRSRRTGSSTWTRSRSSITHRFCTRTSRRPRSPRPPQKPGSRHRTTSIDGPHRLVSTSGIRAWEMDADMRKPIEDICQSGLFGPWDKPDLGEMPVGLNPAKCDPWGLDSFQLFPNFVILFWGQGWYLTYHYWPTSYNTHIFEGTLYFPPAAHPARTGRAGARRGVVQGVRPAGRQHAGGHPDDDRVARASTSSCSATRRCCSGTCTRRPPPGSTTTSARRRGRRTMTRRLAADRFADLEQFSDWCLPTERGALRQAARQLDGRDAGVLRRHHRAGRGGDLLLRQVPPRRHARGRAQPDAPAVLDDHGVVPGRVLEATAGSRLGSHRRWTASPNRSRDRTGRPAGRPRWADVEAGEMHSPAVIVVEGNRIQSVNPAEARCRIRPKRSTSATSRCCRA